MNFIQPNTVVLSIGQKQKRYSEMGPAIALLVYPSIRIHTETQKTHGQEYFLWKENLRRQLFAATI